MFGKNDVLRIELKLGSGGSGAVYKAWHTHLQKNVAIKELKRETASCIDTRRNEVEALKNVKSAYVPQVLDFLTEGDQNFTVMEFVEGESFDKLLIRGQRFSGTQLIKWYSQLAAALESIHKHDVCHRDIKPANIMLTPGGDICLIDFNTAFVGGNDTKIVSRSLGYTSPEQYELFRRYEDTNNDQTVSSLNHSFSPNAANNNSNTAETQVQGYDNHTELVSVSNEREYEISPPKELSQTDSEFRIPNSEFWKRSDIFSLGATMYHLITGNHPPARTEEIIPISNCGLHNNGIVKIIEKSMQIDPKKRFATAEQLSRAIQNIGRQHDKPKHSPVKKAAVITAIATITALVWYGKNMKRT